MRDFELGDGKALKISGAQRQRLKDYLQLVHTKALSNRYGLEDMWTRCINGYQGNLRDTDRWRPFEGAPMIEVTLGASICDAIGSQLEDLIFSIQPPVTVRAKHQEFDGPAESLQDLINWGTAAQGPWNFESGVKEGFIDAIQLGTKVLHIPYMRRVIKSDLRKTKTYRPRIICIDPNDFIIPENAMSDVQEMQWCTYRMHLTPKQVRQRVKMGNWWLDDTQAGDTDSRVRNARLHTAGVTEGTDRDNKPDVQIGLTFAYFDIDDDDIEEDLQIIWNMTSGNILKATYNPYDCRPFVMKPYQARAHLAYGQGAMEMVLPYQRLDSEIQNNFIWNLEISNTKMYGVYGNGVIDEDTRIYPGKVWDLEPGQEIKAIDMGQVNAAPLQAESVVTGMARDRTGAASLTAPVKASSRTPATSMLSMMQQANRRFTHPFNNMRTGVAEAVIQCVYRIQERVKAGDAGVKKQLKKLLGDERAQGLIDYFKRPDWEILDGVDIQVSASSVAVNKEADRQNWMALATQVFPIYWQGLERCAAWIAQPPFPGADKTARKAVTVLNTFWEKILKSFDQVADPKSLQIDLEAIQPVMQQMGMEQVPGQIHGALSAVMGPQGGGPGGMPGAAGQGPQPGQITP